MAREVIEATLDRVRDLEVKRCPVVLDVHLGVVRLLIFKGFAGVKYSCKEVVLEATKGGSNLGRSG